LVDRNDVVAPTNFTAVSCARKVAVRLGNLRAIDRSTAEAFAVVFKTGVLIVVSYVTTSAIKTRAIWNLGLTFTESNTDLDSHVLGRKIRTIKQSAGAAEILETSSVNERSKVGARRLGRLLVTFEGNASIGNRNESESSRSSKKRFGIQHRVGRYPWVP